MTKIVINFSKQSFSYFKDNNIENFYDFSRIWDEERNLFDVNISSSIKVYKHVINKIFEHSFITDIKINDYPIFHLTETAEKHIDWCWLHDFCYFISFVKENICKFEEHDFLEIHAPSQLNSNRKFFEDFFSKNDIKIPYKVYYYGNNNYIKGIKSIVKIFFKFFIFSISSRKKLGNNSEYLFISSSSYKSIVFRSLSGFFKSCGSKLGFLNVNDWVKKSFLSRVEENYLKSKPSLIWVLSLLAKLYALRYTLKVKKSNNIKIEGCNLNLDFLIVELINNSAGEFAICTLINNKWLQKYFSKQKDIKSIFYEDEFYIFGKSISLAKSLSKRSSSFTSYGVQHSHITKFQTLYYLSDNECKTKFPSPDYIIIWGNYYRNLLMQNRINKVTKILPIGIPLYFKDRNIIHNNIHNNNPKKVLWCLTTYSAFLNEVSIIQNSKNIKNFELTIRKHPTNPACSFFNENTISKYNLGHFKIDKLESSIQNKIKQSDLILVSHHSTIINDCIFADKYFLIFGNENFSKASNEFPIPIVYSTKILDNKLKSFMENNSLDLGDFNPEEFILSDSIFFKRHFFSKK